MAEVLERALYRHYESKPEDPKHYITLYKELDTDGYIYVNYVSFHDWDTIHTREEQEFLEIVHHGGMSTARFTLLLTGVITVEEVNMISQRYAENS
jgi:hypothetical protein